tara:strand:+ start:72 stop:287 length:216 start_codon:yes stop_codon:yes gene_type:complete
MTKTEQTKVLKTYQDIISTIKENVTSDLITAISSGNLEIPESETERLTSLITSLIDLYAANGYELFQRTTK